MLSENKPDAALPELNAILQADPNYHLAHYHLAWYYIEKKQPDQAIAEGRLALQGSPNQPYYHNMMGWALETKGDAQGALQEYRAGYLLAPDVAGIKANYERLLKQVNK